MGGDNPKRKVKSNRINPYLPKAGEYAPILVNEKNTNIPPANTEKSTQNNSLPNPLKYLKNNPIGLPSVVPNDNEATDIPQVSIGEPLRKQVQLNPNNPPSFRETKEEQDNYSWWDETVDAAKSTFKNFVNLGNLTSPEGVIKYMADNPHIQNNPAKFVAQVVTDVAGAFSTPFTAIDQLARTQPEARLVSNAVRGLFQSLSYLSVDRFNKAMDIADKYGISTKIKNGFDLDINEWNNLRNAVTEITGTVSQFAVPMAIHGMFKGFKSDIKPKVEVLDLSENQRSLMLSDKALSENISPVEESAVSTTGGIPTATEKPIEVSGAETTPKESEPNFIKKKLEKTSNDITLELADPNLSPKEILEKISIKEKIDEKIKAINEKEIEAQKVSEKEAKKTKTQKAKDETKPETETVKNETETTPQTPEIPTETGQETVKIETPISDKTKIETNVKTDINANSENTVETESISTKEDLPEAVKVWIDKQVSKATSIEDITKTYSNPEIAIDAYALEKAKEKFGTPKIEEVISEQPKVESAVPETKQEVVEKPLEETTPENKLEDNTQALPEDTPAIVEAESPKEESNLLTKIVEKEKAKKQKIEAELKETEEKIKAAKSKIVKPKAEKISKATRLDIISKYKIIKDKNKAGETVYKLIDESDGTSNTFSANALALKRMKELINKDLEAAKNAKPKTKESKVKSEIKPKKETKKKSKKEEDSEEPVKERVPDKPPNISWEMWEASLEERGFEKEAIVTKKAMLEAKDRLSKPSNRMNSLIPVDEIAQKLKDYAIVGAYYIERGVRKFPHWAKEMINRVGGKVKPYLKDLWTKLKNPNALENIHTSGIDVNDIVDAGKKVAKMFVKSETLHNLTKNTKSLFLSRGHFTPETYGHKVELESRLNARSEQIKKNGLELQNSFKEEYKDLNKADKIAMGRVLNKYLTDKTIRESLPIKPKTKMALDTIRKHIDETSQELIDSGILSEETARTAEKNLGEYMTRFYERDYNSNWKEYILNTEEGKRIYDEARKKLIEDYKEEGITKKPAEIDGELLSMLDSHTDPIAGMFSAKKVGSADMGILKHKKDIAPEYRALWGELEDPVANYQRSVYKMAAMLENKKFLAAVRNSELNKTMFSKKLATPDGQFTTLLANSENKSLTPLTHGKDIYTTKEIARAFNEAFEGKEYNKFVKQYFKYSGLIKIGKTAYSPITIARNILTNIPLMTANGHYNFHAIPHAVKVVRTNKFFKEKLDAINHGVIGGSVSLGELADTTKEVFHDGFNKPQLVSDAKSGLSKAHNEVMEFYGHIDDIAKYAGWIDEINKYKKAYATELANKTMTIEQIKKMAAKIITDTMPTYSKTPPIIKKFFRRIPLGNFVSFPAEIMRTAFNIPRIALEEMANPKTHSIGAKRMKGFLSTLAVTSSIPIATRMLMGISDDKENAMRNFLPDWQKNSQYAWTSPDSFIDLSYIDPYNYIKKPVLAMLLNKDPTKAIVNGVSEFISPFAQPEILVNIINSITAGTDLQTKKDIYHKSDSVQDKFVKSLNYAIKQASPGFLTWADRVYKSSINESTTYKKYNLRDELLSITGIRKTKFEPALAFYYKMIEHTEAYKNILEDYHKSITDNQTESNKASSLAKAKDQLQKQISETKDMVEAIKLWGLTDAEIKKYMKDSRMAVRHINAVLNNKEPKLEADDKESDYQKIKPKTDKKK